MRTINYSEQISESEEQLLTLERKQKKGILRLRVRFLHFLKSGECLTQAHAGERIGVNLRQSQKLWKKYKDKGLKDFLSYPYKGHKERINEVQKQDLEQRLYKDDIQSLAQSRQYLEEQYGLHYSIPGVHYIFKRLKIKKKTGRPVHHHRDNEGAEELKKNSCLKANL